MNYCATVRSNYFLVKSTEDFREFCDRWGLEVMETHTDVGGGRVGFTPHRCSEGHITQPADDEDADFVKELAKQLERGEVAIFMEAGNEGVRYVIGLATAVNCRGTQTSISLCDIYKKARRLTKTPDNITVCEY
jgi:hypothetical protein